jgi:hypothetical protein
MTQDTGVQMRGMLAIGKDKFAFYDPLSKSSSKDTKIPPAIRNKSIDMVERTLKKAQVMDATQFQGPKDIAKFADKFIGDQTGVLLLNNQNYPVGFMPIDAAQFSNLRKSGTAINILKGLERANANNAVLISKGNIPPEEMQNIQSFFNASSVRLLDALTGPQRDSLSMRCPSSRTMAALSAVWPMTRCPSLICQPSCLMKRLRLKSFPMARQWFTCQALKGRWKILTFTRT